MAAFMSQLGGGRAKENEGMGWMGGMFSEDGSCFQCFVVFMGSGLIRKALNISIQNMQASAQMLAHLIIPIIGVIIIIYWHMGNLSLNKPNGVLSDAYNPSLNNWNVVERGNEFNIWRNAVTQQQLQQYRFMVNDAQEFEEEKSVFEWRYNNNNLVACRFFVDDSERQFCANYYKGNFFIERIPLRVFELDKIGFPDILHLYSQSLKGFAELYDAVGFFSINEQMMGINTDGVAKVWLNKNYGKSNPEPVYVQGTQRQMLIKLLKTLASYCDSNLPFNLSEVLLKTHPSTFRDAFLTLQALASRYNVDIPDYLSAAFGKMKRVIKNQSAMSSRINSASSLNYMQRAGGSRLDHQRSSMILNESGLYSSQFGKDRKHTLTEDPRRMPVNYDPGHPVPLRQSAHSLTSAFPELSRISRISLPKQRQPPVTPVKTFSPPSKPGYQWDRQAQFQRPNGSAVQFSAPQTPKFQRNTDFYYSTTKNSIPPQTIKHLPIIRQNYPKQNSFNNSLNSFNYHVSDRNKLTEKYVNKIRNPQQVSVFTSLNPESIDFSQSAVKPINQISNRQAIQNPSKVSGDSQLSKFSAFKKSMHEQSSLNGFSTSKQPSINPPKFSLYNQSAKNSQFSLTPESRPIISVSPTGVVYKERQSDEPTFLSQTSGLNKSYSLMQEKPLRQKISMVRPENSLQLRSKANNQYYSTDMDPELLQDLNAMRRKRFTPQMAAS